ncbi:uncharacterized protein LOC135348866 isoform X2 [Halichondria panicea]|uniref:uncharacterized protein LOC135348866 isoform X2 n=1 Tax=Halichondria panicea TaxID=6063 RepID=UPI00312B92A7
MGHCTEHVARNNMKIKFALFWSVAVSVCVRADFVLTVNFINYTNPTGLCAECSVSLSNVASADQLVPVCCDDLPLRNTNCDNTGEESCDTRFHWTIRPFAASLETRPPNVPLPGNPPNYFFTDCSTSPNSVCPFPQVSTTFPQGPLGFLGVAANPLPVVSGTMWTGQTQFFIEAVDSRLPNIIDSLLVNLDNLQLGADFTKEMTFTGYHDVSHMTMSFRVECSPGFCGSNCTTNDPQMATCQTDGTLTCYDNFDLNTSCTECVVNYDLTTNCTSCLFGRNISTRCTTCLFGFTGSNCEPESSLSVGVVGGIAGGVGGVLLLIILVMAVLLLTVRTRKNGNQDISTATTTDKEVTEVMEMNQNPVYSMSTTKTPTTDYEANHTHQYETVDTPIKMNQNPVYSATNATNIEADYYENDGLGPTRNEQQPEYDYVQV